MIREHRFNSEWWGGPAGVLDSAAFFEQPGEEQQQALEAFEWVELRAPLEETPLAAVAAAGFFQVDVQLPFRIALGHVADTPSLAALTVERASETPFTIEEGDLAPFRAERFRHLPGMTAERLTARYATWSRMLLAQSPRHCLRILAGGRVQGWFLSHETGKGMELELAMLHRDATISGLYLYQKALIAYQRDARVGFARFSVANTPVLNIYSRLGAQYLAPVGVWLWIRRR